MAAKNVIQTSGFRQKKLGNKKGAPGSSWEMIRRFDVIPPGTLCHRL